MPRTRAGRATRMPGKSPPLPGPNRTEDAGSGANDSAISPPGVKRSYRYPCPNCGRNALDISRKPHRDGGGMTTVVHCFGCGAGLDTISAATGIPRHILLGWPPPEALGSPVEQSRSAAGRKPEQPPTALVSVWHEHLCTSPRARQARRYLTCERGITCETAREYQLGYGSRDGRPSAFMFPVYDEPGELVALKERYWPEPWRPSAGRKAVKTRNSPGEAHLYPQAALAADPQALVVCEGEFDALLLNQAGIAAITSTASTTWKPEWNRHVAGRYCAVLYDAGATSFDLAERRTAEFREAGARDAWPVDLTLAGFREGEDVTDAVVREGWSADELAAFINEGRREYRRGRRPR